MEKQIIKLQQGGDTYKQWLQLSPIDKFKRNYRIAKNYLSSGPNITNFYNAGKAILGGFEPKNPNLIAETAPSPTKMANKEVLELLSKIKYYKQINRPQRIEELRNKLLRLKYLPKNQVNTLVNNIEDVFNPRSSKYKSLNAIVNRAKPGKFNTKGVNQEVSKAISKEKLTTEEGQLQSIRNKFQKGIDQVNSESRRGNLQLDWSDLNNGNHLGGMPDWLKLEKVGFNEKPFLERYLSNVITKVGPKQKELLNKGLLRPTKDGKHWEGFVDGQYIEVDPYRYVISKLERAEAYGNKVNVLPELEAIIPRHGTSGRKGIGGQAKYMTNPSLEYDQTLYTVEADRSPGANAGINYFRRNNGASIPLMRKPKLEPKYRLKGRTGNSNSSGVADGAKGEVIETPRGVSDPQVGGQPMNEYNFGPGVDNIKSYWNTLDFQYGAGPLAFIINRENNNIV